MWPPPLPSTSHHLYHHSALVPSHPVPLPVHLIPAAAVALSTPSEEDEEEEGGDEDAEPEDAEDRQVLHTRSKV